LTVFCSKYCYVVFAKKWTVAFVFLLRKAPFFSQKIDENSLTIVIITLTPGANPTLPTQARQTKLLTLNLSIIFLQKLAFFS
jgi:hypothetical protein